LQESSVELVKLALQVVIVLTERDGAIGVEGYETIICFFLAVLVDKTATERGHLVAIQGFNFVENTRLYAVTAVFTVLSGISVEGGTTMTATSYEDWNR